MHLVAFEWTVKTKIYAQLRMKSIPIIKPFGSHKTNVNWPSVIDKTQRKTHKNVFYHQ